MAASVLPNAEFDRLLEEADTLEELEALEKLNKISGETDKLIAQGAIAANTTKFLALMKMMDNHIGTLSDQPSWQNTEKLDALRKRFAALLSEFGAASAGSGTPPPSGAGGAGAVTPSAINASPTPGISIAGPATVSHRASVPGNAAPSGAVRVIDITDADLDALQRVAQSEVGGFGRHGEAQLRGGLAAVVDTVLNRVAHPRWPDDIQSVIDQPKQFSAINETGSWTGLPEASSTVAAIVKAHVEARAGGASAEIGGATHFLNPHLSSASALASWGNYVVNNAVAIYGSDEAKSVHYHGFAPGTALPPPYGVARRGSASTFDSNGRSVGGPISNADIRNAIVRICREELARFNGGTAKETDDPQFLRVGDYWQAVDQPMNGRTLNSDGKRPPWSSAFISFVLRTAGAEDRFKYSVAHCHYFQDFVDRAGPALYEALPASEAIPQIGDIVHYGRGGAEKFDFTLARESYGQDSFYSSHSSIVVAVDEDKTEIVTIGGNESDSVAERTYALDSNGHLRARKSRNRNLPWIGVLRLT